MTSSRGGQKAHIKGTGGGATVYAWVGGDDDLEIALAPGQLATILWGGIGGDGGSSDVEPVITVADGDDPVSDVASVEADTDRFFGLTWVTGNGTYGVGPGSGTTYIQITVAANGGALPVPGDPPGAIITASVGAGGANYIVGELAILNGSGNGDAIVEVDSVDGGGAVLTLHVTQAGSGYTVEAGVGTTFGGPGIGTGLTVDVDSVAP